MKSSSSLLVATLPQPRHFASKSQCFSPTARKWSCRILRAQEQSSSSDPEQPPEESTSSADESKEPVRVEVASSVMRMFESGSGDSGVGLIEMNQRKRRQGTKPAEELKREDEEEQALNLFKQELFASHKLYVPKHDTLFPFLIATAAVFLDDDNEIVDLETSVGVDRFSSSFPRMKAIVEEDVERLKRKSSFLPSQLFCDLNGEPVNSTGDAKLEAWFLLSMYVKFKLWWKGPTSAAETALEYAYRITNFVFDQENELDRVFEQLPSFVLGKKRAAIRYGRLLHGKFKNREHPRALLSSLQLELDKTKRGWAAFLMPPEAGDDPADDEEIACLITHRNSLIFLNIPHDISIWIASFLLLWAGAFSFNAGAGQIDSLTEQALVPVGFLSVIAAGSLARTAMASVYGVSSRVTPQFIIPVPQLGAIPSFVYHSGVLPSRASLFDISAASSIAGLALSALLISSAGSQASIVVPSTLFHYSTLLNWVASRVSAEQGELVMSPVAFGGVLGLSFTLFSLLPVTISDGGRMIGAAFGRPLLRSVSSFTFAFITVSLLSKNLVLGFLWACTCTAMPEDSFQRDEVSDPGLARRVVAALLTAGALAAFVPVF